MVNQLGRGLAFEAKDAAVGMVIIGFEPNHFSVDYRRNRRTMCSAESAKAAHRLGSLSRIQHRLLDYSNTAVIVECQL